MHVMRRQRRIAKRDEERPHFVQRQFLPGLDRRFARDGRRQVLVPRGGCRGPIPRQGRQRVAQALLGVEPWMRHRHGVHDQRVSAKPFDLEAELRESLTIRLERVGFDAREMQREGKEQTLGRRVTALEYSHESLEQDTLVRRMLIDEHHAVLVLEHDVGAAQLE